MNDFRLWAKVEDYINRREDDAESEWYNVSRSIYQVCSGVEMPITESKNTLRDVLYQGMTSGHEDADWYIKTWFTRDPTTFTLSDLPVGLILAGSQSRVDLYVQEDSENDDVVIHFFPIGINRAVNYAVGQDAVEAMVERCIRIIRVDPTLGHQVYSAQVMGSTFRQPGMISNMRVHSGEVRVQMKQRAPWPL